MDKLKKEVLFLFIEDSLNNPDKEGCSTQFILPVIFRDLLYSI